MNKMNRVMFQILSLAAIILLYSCDLFISVSSGNNNNPKSDVDFNSYNTNYSILVRNNSGERLVAFKGDLQDDKLMGGIPAHAQNHGLFNNLTLFDKTEDFPMILLTEEQYNTHKDNLNFLRNTPFTRVYVFFNKNGDNSVVYEIAEGLGGNNELKIINASNSINVELRLGGVAGETLGYAPAGILETTLKLQDGNYDIFPVFKRYNTFRDLPETVFPKGTGSNYAWFESHSFGENTTSATMNLKNLLQTTTFTSGTAWVVINNQTTSGGIRFISGSHVYTTASGLTNIMNGNIRTFQIDMPKVGTKYEDSVVVSNWRFGATGFEVSLQQDEDDSTEVTTLTIERDKMYTVTVTGSHNDNSLKAWISNITIIPSEDIAGEW